MAADVIAEDFEVIGAQITATLGTSAGTITIIASGSVLRGFTISLANPAGGAPTTDSRYTGITVILVPKQTYIR